MTAEYIDGIDGLVRLEPAWHELARRSTVDHPFASYEWTRTWWDAFGAGRTLRVAVVREGPTVMALAPVVSEGRGGGDRWQSPTNAHSPRFDVLVGGDPAPAYTALWTALAPRAPAGRLELAELAGNSATTRIFAALARQQGLFVGLHPGAWSPRVVTTGRWDVYAASLSRRHRDNVQARLRRLERSGAVRLESVTGGSDMAEALADGFRLEAAAWKQAAHTAIVSCPAVTSFYRGLAERAAARGWLRLIFLVAGGRRVAFAFVLAFRDRLFLLKTGYDPSVARESPGQLLVFLLLREAFCSPVREVDFLGACDDWKKSWTADGRSHCRLTVLPSSVRGMVEHTARFRIVPALQRSPAARHCYAWVRGWHGAPVTTER